MQKMKSILLATDFRAASSRAAEAAAQLAAAFGAHVNLLHVVDVLPTITVLQHQYTEHAVDLLSQVSGQLAARKVDVTSMPLGIGSRADVIVRTANEAAADLIVIGAGELTVADVYSAGSVAEAVVQHATQPVLAIRPGTAPVRFAKILCAVDHSDVSRDGLQTAIGLAKACGGALVVVSVVPPLRWFDKTSIVPPLQWFDGDDAIRTLQHANAEHDKNWRAEFPRFLERVKFGNVPWNNEIRAGDPSAEIVAAAQKHQADLIVMGATGRSGVRRLLMGSVVRHVLRQLPCSLLTVRAHHETPSAGGR